MSEHELPDEDGALSELYRRSAAATPSPHLDAQVISQARRQSLQIRDARMRHWLPVASVAVVVMAVGLLLHVVQAPPLQQQTMAERAPLPAAAPPPEVASAMAPPAKAEIGTAATKDGAEEKPGRGDRSTASRVLDVPEERPRSKKRVDAPETVFDDASEGEAPAKARVLAEPLGDAEGKLRKNVPSAAAKEVAQPENTRAKQEETAAPEPAGTWLKRIEALRVKGELDAARRELVKFRKAYPEWTLPKELQPLVLPAPPPEGK